MQWLYRYALGIDGLLKNHGIMKLSTKNDKSGFILGNHLLSDIKFCHDKKTRYNNLLRKAINYAYHEWKAVVRYIKIGIGV